jgi:hypothetical protein
MATLPGQGSQTRTSRPFWEASVSPTVTTAGFNHHFQRSDLEKEWNCWVWEGSGILLNSGCRLVGSSCAQRVVAAILAIGWEKSLPQPDGGDVLHLCSCAKLNAAVMDITLGRDGVFIVFCGWDVPSTCRLVVIAIVHSASVCGNIGCYLSEVLSAENRNSEWISFAI